MCVHCPDLFESKFNITWGTCDSAPFYLPQSFLVKNTVTVTHTQFLPIAPTDNPSSKHHANSPARVEDILSEAWWRCSLKFCLAQFIEVPTKLWLIMDRGKREIAVQTIRGVRWIRILNLNLSWVTML